MYFGRNTSFILASILSGALAQLQKGSNYHISALFGSSVSDQDLDICADFSTGGIILKWGGCDSPTQGTCWVNHPRSPQNFHTFYTPQSNDGCGRFGCQFVVEPTPGSTVRLGTEASPFEIMRVTDDMYKVVLAANPSLYWTLQYEGNSAGAASIVLKEVMKNGSLQTFKFVGD